MSLRDELERARNAAAGLDRQAVTVLLGSGLFVILQMQFGDRRWFREELGELFPESIRILASWGWWFGMQGVLGFVIPVLLLLYLFRRSPSEVGLGLGDVKFAGIVALLYLPVVVTGAWVLSAQDAFLFAYPHYRPAATNWNHFLIYQVLFLFYWIGWEYLWRGFVLFGTAHVFGYYAIIIQAVPFAVLHFNKPFPEAVLSLVGGVLLGAIVWRARSFWIAVPIHFVQMLAIDFFGAIRLRSGVRGLGPGDLLEALSSVF